MLARTPLHEVLDRTTLEPWRALLLDGTDRIEQRGHTKNQLCNQKTGALCTRGALLDLRPMNAPGWCMVHIEADRHLAVYLKVDALDGVALWNNAPERTAEEVVAAMRGCALEGLGL